MGAEPRGHHDLFADRRVLYDVGELALQPDRQLVDLLGFGRPRHGVAVDVHAQFFSDGVARDVGVVAVANVDPTFAPLHGSTRVDVCHLDPIGRDHKLDLLFGPSDKPDERVPGGVASDRGLQFEEWYLKYLDSESARQADYK